MSLYELIDDESAQDALVGLPGLSISEQCDILGVGRSGYYRWRSAQNRASDSVPEQKVNDARLKLANTVLDFFAEMPFIGYRKMSELLRAHGYEDATEKRIRLLYKQLGLKGVKPKFKTTRPSEHPAGKFPYLLKGRTIRYVNEVWSTDITYIRLPTGMVYLTAILDYYSRKVLSYRLSNTMDTSFCIECMKEAVRKHGIPAICNTDQGSQYTSKEFIDLLLSLDIRISMDGKGRCLDNIIVERYWRSIKYECIFLNDWKSMPQLKKGVDDYIKIYNSVRPHQSLGYLTPDEVYEKGCFLEETDKTSNQVA